MKTQNTQLLQEIDALENLKGVDANELEVVIEIDRLTQEKNKLLECIDDVRLDLIETESEVVKAYWKAKDAGCCTEDCIHDVIKTYLEQVTK